MDRKMKLTEHFSLGEMTQTSVKNVDNTPTAEVVSNLTRVCRWLEMLRDEWNRKREAGESTDITDDIVFEIELIKQIEVNIDYILMLVKKYHDSHCKDKEVLITIKKAVDASPELRSKKALIETFIAGINDVDDVLVEWRSYVSEEREKQLMQIITEEKLNEAETRRF